MTEPWHCAQIPNGDNPLVVCQRETLAAENTLLRSIVRKLKTVDSSNWPARNHLRIDLTADEAALFDTITTEETT